MIIKSSRLLLAGLLLTLSTATPAWWGGGDGFNCWPVWTPMYWMEEMDDFMGSDYLRGSGPYSSGLYGYGALYGIYGYGPYGYPPGPYYGYPVYGYSPAIEYGHPR